MPSLDDNHALLTYRVGPVLCCGPTLPILAIIPAPKLTRPPGTTTAEPGIFKHNQYLVSATDLRYRFGVAEEKWHHPARVIITTLDNQYRGYYVDEILDVIEFPTQGWDNLPAYLPRGVFSRTLLYPTRQQQLIYLYTEFEKLATLQGSGYLHEYIQHLETAQEKSQKQKHVIAANTLSSQLHRSDRPVASDSKPESKTRQVIPPAEKQSPDPETKILRSGKSDLSKPATDPTSIPTPTPVLPQSDTVSSHQIIENTQDQPLKHIPRIKNTSSHIAAKSPPAIKPAQVTCTKTQAKTESTVSQTGTAKSCHIHPAQQLAKSVTTSARQTEPQAKTADTPHNIVSHHAPDHNKNSLSGTIWGISFLLLIAGLGTGGYYYLHSTMITDDTITKTYPLTNTTSELATITIPPTETTTPVSLSKSVTETTSVPPPTPEVEPETSLLAKNTEPSIPVSPPPDNSANYQAKINTYKNEITIVLTGPEAEFKTQPSTVPVDPKTDNAAVQNDVPASVSVSPESAENPLIMARETHSETMAHIKKLAPSAKSDSSEAKKSSPLAVSEITHIVIKGDTLWHIAKHYLNNPFRYPELAQLSKIKNPDLIYPGNIVRIIYHQNTKLD